MTTMFRVETISDERNGRKTRIRKYRADRKGEEDKRAYFAEEYHRRRYSRHGLFPPSDQNAGVDRGAGTVLYTQPLCLPATDDRDRQTEKRTHRH